MVPLASDARADVAGFLAQVAAIVTAITVIGGALAWLVWPRFKAFLQSELIEPLHETRQQVKNNGHRHEEPTLRDQLMDVKEINQRNRRTLIAVQGDVAALKDRVGSLEQRQGRQEGREERRERGG